VRSESSSGHTLNADLPMSRLARLRWIGLNWRNNSAARKNVDQGLILTRFAAGGLDEFWTRIDPTVSPARRLCDLFWLSLPWTKVAAALGGTVRVLEIGCGSGRYGELLRDCLGGAFGGYRGLDVVRDEAWPALQRDPRFEFVCAGSDATAQYAGDANLIFTQSALEHFEGDMTFFRQLQTHIAGAGRPVLQLHLIPSAGCLRTFLWHGVRQYTPRTTSHITGLFGADCGKLLYALGGARCNRLHRRYVTWPWLFGRGDRRRQTTALYDAQLREAIRLDDAAPAAAEACFYALALLHGVPGEILPP